MARLAQRAQDGVVAATRGVLERDDRAVESYTALEVVRITVDTYLGLFEHPTPDERALIVMWGATFPSEASIDGMVEADHRGHEGWADVIADGQRDGSIREDVDPTDGNHRPARVDARRRGAAVDRVPPPRLQRHPRDVRCLDRRGTRAPRAERFAATDLRPVTMASMHVDRAECRPLTVDLSRPVSADEARDHRAAGHWADDVAVCLETLRAHAERTALVDRRGAITYAELASAVERVAAALHDLGVVRGDAVVVVTDNDRESVAATHAVWHLGAVAVLVHRSAGAADLEVACRAVPPAVVLLAPAAEALRDRGDDRRRRGPRDRRPPHAATSRARRRHPSTPMRHDS